MSTMSPICGDVYYGSDVVKGCRSELVIVPDPEGTGHTVCCPRCDKVTYWPRLIQAGRDHA